MSDGPCAAAQRRLAELDAEIRAVQASVPAPPLPPAESRQHEHRLWVLNQGRIAAAAALAACRSASPNHTLKVSGRFLTDRRGDTVVLRGANYPLLDDWDFPGSDRLAEIANPGANAVRIQWYVEYGDASRPSYAIGDLGRVIDACAAARIVPIVMLADLTCQGDPALFNARLMPWWTPPAVVNVLKPRQGHLILNLANELGRFRWADDRPAALKAYLDAYKAAIAGIWQAGYALPLMIDAPDCGTTLDALTSVGAELIASDPLGNVLLSTHAYRAGYDGRPHLATAVAADLPIVFGEVVDKQDETAGDGSTLYEYYDLDGTHQGHPPPTGFAYQGFLATLLADEIGWLAWCWTKDRCADRQMSRDGSFSALTPYGDDIVNNPTYGLKATARAIPA